MRKRYEMDMCSGPLLSKIIVFALPLMATGMLQLFYNAADIVVVGKFAGTQSLAAVGSTGALINLIINLLIGLSVGTSVLTSNYYGAGKPRDVSATVHTSIAIAGVGGVVFGLLGLLAATPLLRLMGTPEEVVGEAALYLRIYFIGLPATMLYNFGSAVLRAVGDTKHPLYYLSIAGVVNVGLNLLFVIVFRMGAGGVALATVLSQCLSVALVLNYLLRTDGCIRLNPRELRVDRDKLLRILRIGLPAGLQSTVFSISNVIIQSSVNAFGSVVMAGNAASGNIEGFVSTGNNAMHQAALAFSAQNMGAKQYRRVGRVLAISVGLGLGISGAMGLLIVALGAPLLGVYTVDPQVIEMGMIRLRIMCLTYPTCALMDVMTGEMRGMGYSIMPMLVTVIGVCGIRITWLFTVFQMYRNLEILYMSYPVSWSATALVHIGCFIFVYRRMLRDHPGPDPAPNAAV